MAIEIERKFLVKGEGWRGAVSRRRRIRQGYLANGGRVSVRVRGYDGAEAVLTIKSAEPGTVRDEFEYDIPMEDAEHLFDLCSGVVIEKERHEARFGGLLWEIDVFHGANQGLVVAELELESKDQAFERPDWLGEEITGDRRYYNSALSERPYGAW
jgi:adenylate cyclase